MSELTASDVLAMTRNNDNGIFGGNGASWLIILILFFLTGGGFGLGNNTALTRAELADGLNAQNTFSEFRSVQNEITNGFANVNQNLCAGFGGVNQNLNNGFNSINANIQGLSAQMAQCCCDIKTTLHNEGEQTRAMITQNTIQELRDKVAAKDRELLTSTLVTSNALQTNNLEAYLRQIVNNGCGCGC